MAEGASEAAVNAFLSALFQGTAFALTDGWVQWHVAAPGPNGTDNPAAETRRVQSFGSFGTDPTTGEIVNDIDLPTLLAVAATEVWSHWSYWNDETAGSFWFSGTLAGGSVTLGDDVTVAAGQMTVDMPTAA